MIDVQLAPTEPAIGERLVSEKASRLRETRTTGDCVGTIKNLCKLFDRLLLVELLLEQTSPVVLGDFS
jgi:hypothetical protein